jgi:hypothetical protein
MAVGQVGEWCQQQHNTPVSKTGDAGANPASPAIIRAKSDERRMDAMDFSRILQETGTL